MTNAELIADPAPPNRDRQLAEQRQQLDERRGYGYGYGYGALPEDEDVIDLRAYWNILVRRRGTIFTILGIAVVTALIATFLTTPIYRGSLLLQIERESGKVVEYESLTPEESLSAKDFYETQYELLRSRSLARRVIDQLGLQSSKSFRNMDEPSLVGRLVSQLKGLVSGNASDGEEIEPDYEGFFLDNLHVTPVKNSRLVRVEYDSPDPQEAAAVANALAENFVNTTLERRYDASSYAQSFLQERIQQARANLEDSERRLIAYAKEREIINLDDKLEILMQSLKETNTALVGAEAERIAAEAEFRQMMDQGSVRTAGGLESPVIQQYKARKAELETAVPGEPEDLQARLPQDAADTPADRRDRPHDCR